MTEREQADRIANDWLDFKMNPLTQMVHGDPDCDALVLARQYNRLIATLEYIRAQAKAAHPGALAVIETNAASALDGTHDKIRAALSAGKRHDDMQFRSGWYGSIAWRFPATGSAPSAAPVFSLLGRFIGHEEGCYLKPQSPQVSAMTIDEHPLRYAKVTQEIEGILFRRSLERRLGGYVLETALEIAERLVGTGKRVPLPPYAGDASLTTGDRDNG